jgi:hypothetical protein
MERALIGSTVTQIRYGAADQDLRAGQTFNPRIKGQIGRNSYVVN